MGRFRAVVEVPATSVGPATARRVVGAVLEAWELTELSGDAQLVVTELVSNAYRHAPGTDSFEVEVAPRGRRVRISVADGSAIRPIVRELNDQEASGRGMRIVEQLAADWGAEDYHGGKRVWVDLDIDAYIAPEPPV